MNVEEFVEEIIDNLNITIYGKTINYREFELRYYKSTANWINNVVMSYLNKEKLKIEDFSKKMSNDNFYEIIKISEFYSDIIPFNKCKEIFFIMLETGEYPWVIISDLGLLNKSDINISNLIKESIKNNTIQYEKYKNGNINMKNFFIGDILKKHKVNSKELSSLLDIMLND